MHKIIEEINITTLLGFIAGTLTAISMLPQLIKTIKTKEATDVSILMLIILLAGIILWIVYGIMKNDLPIIITNGISLLINCIMIYCRFRYKK